MKKEIGYALAGLALASSAPALSQNNNEVIVGVLDVKGDGLTFADKNTVIEYREFNEKEKDSARWITESGLDHGEMMVSAFTRQFRKIDQEARLRILSANIFQENQSSTRSALYSRNSRKGSTRGIAINWEGAKEALQWFKQRGVRVVVTAFNGNDSAGMRSFMEESKSLGMIVFASAGNVAGGPAYPAKYKETISVAADNPDLAFRNDPTMQTWVNFTMNGSVPKSKEGKNIDAGSSFASAKLAAYGAYFSSRDNGMGAEEIKNAIKSIGVSETYRVNGTEVAAIKINENTIFSDKGRDQSQINAQSAMAMQSQMGVR